jgi:hypothetical protein
MINTDAKPRSKENVEDHNTDVRPDTQNQPQSDIKKKEEPCEENENETTLDKFIYSSADGHCGFIAVIALLIIIGLLVNMSLSDTFLRQSVELTVQIQSDYSGTLFHSNNINFNKNIRRWSHRSRPHF